MSNDYCEELFELINNLISEYIDNNIINFYKYTFIDQLKDDISEIVVEQLSLIENISKDEIFETIDDSLDYYYKHIMPIRSFDNNKSNNIPNINNIGIKIEKIKNKPQPEQRSNEWYWFRYNLITASNAYKIFGSDAKINEIICEKCKEFSTESYKSNNIDTAMHWGVRYEPVSVMYYEFIYDTKVDDFGCIQHDNYKFFGASPDGINTKSDSKLYGRMLEIKNPKSRVITGIPKDEYWIQMQLQLEVCDLNYCDFLETKFTEYQDCDEFNNDGNFNLTNDGKYKGIILHFMKDASHIYEYQPFQCLKEEFNNWEEETMNKKEKEGCNWIQNIYWKLDIVSCVLVLRNKIWFSNAIKSIGEIWKIIEKERIDKTWVNRKPKPNNKRVKNNINKVEKGQNLLIKIDI
tara:strand:+ start:1430 stop:2647 length:1218 start_codon:yes stop_codon:yes gene_type:complete